MFSTISPFTISSANASATISSITPNWSDPNATSSTLPANHSPAFTQVVSQSVDDGSVQIAFPFSINFLGQNYSSVFIGSNTYLTFGAGSSIFSGISPSNPALPGIHLCARDNSYQKVMWRENQERSIVRIRY
jgi:hypothetical protein